VVTLLDGPEPPLINAKDTKGSTAVMIASEQGHQTVVEALLARGADVAFRNKDQKTAETLATTDEIKALLRVSCAWAYKA
jgi:ankyrin repeat protein